MSKNNPESSPRITKPKTIGLVRGLVGGLIVGISFAVSSSLYKNTKQDDNQELTANSLDSNNAENDHNYTIPKADPNGAFPTLSQGEFNNLFGQSLELEVQNFMYTYRDKQAEFLKKYPELSKAGSNSKRALLDPSFEKVPSLFFYTKIEANEKSQLRVGIFNKPQILDKNDRELTLNEIRTVLNDNNFLSNLYNDLAKNEKDHDKLALVVIKASMEEPEDKVKADFDTIKQDIDNDNFKQMGAFIMALRQNKGQLGIQKNMTTNSYDVLVGIQRWELEHLEKLLDYYIEDFGEVYEKIGYSKSQYNQTVLQCSLIKKTLKSLVSSLPPDTVQD